MVGMSVRRAPVVACQLPQEIGHGQKELRVVRDLLKHGGRRLKHEAVVRTKHASGRVVVNWPCYIRRVGYRPLDQIEGAVRPIKRDALNKCKQICPSVHPTSLKVGRYLVPQCVDWRSVTTALPHLPINS